MSMDDLYESLEHIIITENMNNEELKKLVLLLYGILKKQNELIYDFKNNYIKIDNKLKDLETKLEECKTYKKLCEMILDKIGGNPINSWWFLYQLKKKLLKYNEQ